MTSAQHRRVNADAIYQRPDDYDLEHTGDDQDVRFYCRLASRLAPSRVLELGCGSGRVTTCTRHGAA